MLGDDSAVKDWTGAPKASATTAQRHSDPAFPERIDTAYPHSSSFATIFSTSSSATDSTHLRRNRSGSCATVQFFSTITAAAELIFNSLYKSTFSLSLFDLWRQVWRKAQGSERIGPL